MDPICLSAGGVAVILLSLDFEEGHTNESSCKNIAETQTNCNTEACFFEREYTLEVFVNVWYTVGLYRKR